MRLLPGRAHLSCPGVVSLVGGFLGRALLRDRRSGRYAQAVLRAWFVQLLGRVAVSLPIPRQLIPLAVFSQSVYPARVGLVRGRGDHAVEIVP